MRKPLTPKQVRQLREPTPLSLTELKLAMSMVFRDAEYGRRYVVMSHGREIAGIVSMDDLQKLEGFK